MALLRTGAGTLLVLAAIFCGAPAGAATISVNNLLDTDADGDGCTLREAIQNANGDNTSGSTDCTAGAGLDAIEFDVSGTIVLGSTLPAITDNDELVIDGTGQAIVLSGNGSVQILVVSAGGVLRLRNLTVTLGIANFGGGVNVAGGGSLIAERVTFSANGGNFGGAIYNLGFLSAIDTSFSGNTGFISAGAISHSGGGTAVIDRCTFSENSGPSDAGAILVQGGTMTIFSSTFSGNKATFGTGNGGAILLNSGTVAIANSTFSANESALAGSAISVPFGSLVLTDSIVANGVTGTNCDGTITDGGGNLTWPAPDASCPGTAGDPMLFPLGNNGGFTDTFELQAGSAAYDSPEVVHCPDIDQRFLHRPLGEHCDIGAVEGVGTPGLLFWGDFETEDLSGWSMIVP